MIKSDVKNQYIKDVSCLDKIDIYRICEMYDVHGPKEHAVKKILMAGRRGGGKTEKRDIKEAIVSLTRHLEMIEEGINVTSLREV